MLIISDLTRNGIENVRYMCMFKVLIGCFPAWFIHIYVPAVCISTFLHLRVCFKASLWTYRLWPVDIQWSSLAIRRERSLSSISSSLRHPADTSMYYKTCLSRISLPTVRKRRSIDLNWLTGWFQELCMDVMVSEWEEEKSIQASIKGP